MYSDMDVLHGARALIAEHAHWCQGSLATNESGRGVEPWAPNARCWCLLGALQASLYSADPKYTNTDMQRLTKPLRVEIRLRSENSWDSVTDFNDANCHDEVLEVLDAVIG